jgi:hypothetical protein
VRQRAKPEISGLQAGEDVKPHYVFAEANRSRLESKGFSTEKTDFGDPKHGQIVFSAFLQMF